MLDIHVYMWIDVDTYRYIDIDIYVYMYTYTYAHTNNVDNWVIDHDNNEHTDSGVVFLLYLYMYT